MCIPGYVTQRPLGPEIALTLTIEETPDWDSILRIAQALDELYDAQAELDQERRLADMRFPS